jgi:geranylgeranyl pyrophosphate synthase
MITNPKNNMETGTYFEDRQQRVNSFLDKLLPNIRLAPTHLHEAMRYAVLNGGKRIRPLLVYATGEALGVRPEILDIPASAIELIHAYSLVHDDLPAMDDDDLRRGKPTCHKAFDEATAILVGDSLQSLAFATLAEETTLIPASTRIAMIACLAKAAGSLGMAGGQALDLKATGQKLDSSEIETIHHLKTGQLIAASTQLAILAANLKDRIIYNALLDFSSKMGLCFQIKDDILDQIGDTKILGKQAGSDLAKQKVTFTTMNSLTYAKAILEQVYQEALNALTPLNEKAITLKSVADYIVARDY